MERNYDAQIEDAFRCFDKKGLGTIPRQDFEMLFEVSYRAIQKNKTYLKTVQNLGEKLSDEEKEGLLDEADRDQEGFISYSEFCSIKYCL